MSSLSIPPATGPLGVPKLLQIEEIFVILTDRRWVFEDLRSAFAVGTTGNPTSVRVYATAGHHPVLVSRASQKAVESPCHLIADRSVAVKGMALSRVKADSVSTWPVS
jgi:hypothetical protein